MGLELVTNHFQMTYYLLLLVICIGIAYLIDAFKKKMLPHYFKAVGIMAIGVLIAVGLNATNILATKEYADTSTRGKSELTINPDGTQKKTIEGLDYEYITEYSYGKLESFNLLIPRFMGGGSSEPLPEDGETVEALIKMGASPQEANQVLQQLPVYWGDQPIVAAPAYIGAILLFLAVVALFLIRGRLKWWAVAGLLLSLFLSWGQNFDVLTRFFIDTVPLYDKFRAVSSIQVLIELIIPILAIVGLHQFFSEFTKEEKRKKALLFSTGILGGIIVLFMLLKNAIPGFDFASPYDAGIREQLGNELVEAVRADRASLFMKDALRSLVLILLAAGALWFFLKDKLKQTPVIGILIVLVLFDLVGVDKRYVSNDDFVQKRIVEQPFQMSAADEMILKDDGHFRVYDATNNAFNSGAASYYHNALGGYHAAKPGRMQDIADFYLYNGDVGIMNMLNVKYFIVQNKGGGPVAQRNPYANGPVWFVENVQFAETADAEIQLLDSLDTKKTVIVHSEFKDQLPLESIQRDSTATIELVQHQPNHLTYEASTKSPQMAVFSEVYYPEGWNAYINGKPAEYIRVNYVLRGMKVPAGNNKIEFKFEAAVVKKGSSIALGSSMLLVLILLGGLFFTFKKKKETNS